MRTNATWSCGGQEIPPPPGLARASGAGEAVRLDVEAGRTVLEALTTRPRSEEGAARFIAGTSERRGQWHPAFRLRLCEGEELRLRPGAQPGEAPAPTSVSRFGPLHARRRRSVVDGVSERRAPRSGVPPSCRPGLRRPPLPRRFRRLRLLAMEITGRGRTLTGVIARRRSSSAPRSICASPGCAAPCSRDATGSVCG